MALHYVEAGKILDRISAAGAKPFSLKKMLYQNADKKVNIGVVFALVSETLKCALLLYCGRIFPRIHLDATLRKAALGRTDSLAGPPAPHKIADC